jgi:hypothetical protein
MKSPFYHTAGFVAKDCLFRGPFFDLMMHWPMLSKCTKQVRRLVQILALDSNTVLRFLDLDFLQRLWRFPILISVAKYRLKLGRLLG